MRSRACGAALALQAHRGRRCGDPSWRRVDLEILIKGSGLTAGGGTEVHQSGGGEGGELALQTGVGGEALWEVEREGERYEIHTG